MVKFGDRLDLAIHASWKSYYLDYNRFKRIIIRNKFIADKKKKSVGLFEEISSNADIEMAVRQAERTNDESTPLAKSLSSNSLSIYSEVQTEVGIVNDTDDFIGLLQMEVDKINTFFISKISEINTSFDLIMKHRRNAFKSHHSSSDLATDLQSIRNTYLELSALNSYIDFNKTGLRKIVKKFDKVFNKNELQAWMPLIESQIFVTSTEPKSLMDGITEMIGREKLQEWDRHRFENSKSALEKDAIFTKVKPLSVIISIFIGIVSLIFPVNPGDASISKCMSVLIFTVALWVTEALPYYTTSMLVCPLIVFSGVLKNTANLVNPNAPMQTEAAAIYVMSNLFNHTSCLLLGGYTISSAFASCQLELRAASWLQRRLGNSPKLFILAIMFLGLFLSMWISNTTAPILCAALLTPIVRDLPSDAKFSKALLLGLAIACNFGGMTTPISSVQNVLAVSALQQIGISVSFGVWMLVTIPFCSVCVFVSWCIILAIIDPDDVDTIPVIVYERGNIYGAKNMVVMASSLVTILLFATSSLTENFFGDIGTISILYVVFMYGSGILSEVDFNCLSWHLLMLIGGGNVLGCAVTNSGLLTFLANMVTDALPLTAPWGSLTLIMIFCASVATFVSHTVAGIILLPIIAQLGVTIGDPVTLVICSVFSISAAMALPFSSFPNVCTLFIVDDFYQSYLSVVDFVKVGVPVMLFTLLMISTVGYQLVNVLFLDNV